MTKRPAPPSDPVAIKALIAAQARALGFDVVGFAAAESSGDAARVADLAAYLAEGRHGDMAWMETTEARRATVKGLWPEAESVIALGCNYTPPYDALGLAGHPDRGVVSAYARNKDYHDLVKRRLKQLGTWLAQTFGCPLKVFTDTAPIMEKPAAARAGLGWQGRHTSLVSRQYGSWLFLGEIVTTLVLPPDAPHRDQCGSCRRCLPACPTAAIAESGRIDARRCISYLTIEHKGHIAADLRPLIGNRVYGCDDCLAVCPWNKFAPPTTEADFLPRAELMAPRLTDLAALDDAGFREVFAGSPIKRIGRDRLVRNALIALGNSGTPSSAPAARRLLDDPAPVVRAMAVWACRRLLPDAAFQAEKSARAAGEADLDVRAEWEG